MLLYSSFRPGAASPSAHAAIPDNRCPRLIDRSTSDRDATRKLHVQKPLQTTVHSCIVIQNTSDEYNFATTTSDTWSDSAFRAAASYMAIRLRSSALFGILSRSCCIPCVSPEWLSGLSRATSHPGRLLLWQHTWTGYSPAYLLAKSAWTKQKGKHRKNNWTSKRTRLHHNPLLRVSLDSSLSSSVRTEARLASHAMECNDSPHPYRVGAHSQSVIATASRRGKNFSGTPAVVEQVTGTNRNRQHGNRNTKTGRLTLQYVPA